MNQWQRRIDVPFSFSPVSQNIALVWPMKPMMDMYAIQAI